MRWFKPNLRSSLHAIFSSNCPESAPTAAMEYDIEDIRQAMLGMMNDVQDAQFPQLVRRIRYASDVQALWFLRGDLMAVLAGSYGEVAAREKLDLVSAMFENLLPDGLRSRPSPLSAIRHDDDLLIPPRPRNSGFKPSS
jgi:hypothetical protein